MHSLGHRLQKRAREPTTGNTSYLPFRKKKYLILFSSFISPSESTYNSMLQAIFAHFGHLYRKQESFKLPLIW